MTIYVDALFDWSGAAYSGPAAAQAFAVGARNGHRWCHMVSDQGPDASELHVMAAKIGLRRDWFQGDHYDLTPAKRAAALAAGAQPADRAKIVGIFKTNRVRRLSCKGCGCVITLKSGETAPASCPRCGRGAKKDVPNPDLFDLTKL